MRIWKYSLNVKAGSINKQVIDAPKYTVGNRTTYWCFNKPVNEKDLDILPDNVRNAIYLTKEDDEAVYNYYYDYVLRRRDELHELTKKNNRLKRELNNKLLQLGGIKDEKGNKIY